MNLCGLRLLWIKSLLLAEFEKTKVNLVSVTDSESEIESNHGRSNIRSQYACHNTSHHDFNDDYFYRPSSSKVQLHSLHGNSSSYAFHHICVMINWFSSRKSKFMFREHEAQPIQRENKGILKKNQPTNRWPRISTGGSLPRPMKKIRTRQVSEDI